MTVAGWLVQEREGSEGRPSPLPCNFKRGKREWIVLARPFACMHKQGGSLYVGGEWDGQGESEGRRGEQNNPFAPPFFSSRLVYSDIEE